MGGQSIFQQKKFSSIAVPSTALVFLPLIVIGSGTAVAYLKAYVGRTVRKLINLLDPIKPSEDHVKASALNRPCIPINKVESHIQERENTVVQGAERTITWNNPHQKTKTPLCVIFLHGWGACRQECRPIPEMIADSIHSNLYCGRLPGHGRRHRRGSLGGGGPDGDTLVEEATAHELFLCAIESLRIGLSLGDKVVLIGMSTGGALTTWLASLDCVKPHLAGLVLVSPAYALGHPLYPVLKHSFSTLRLLPFVSRSVRAALISLAVGGKTKTSPVLNEEHNRYNSLTYPSEAILHLLDVLWELETIDFASIEIPTIMIGNPKDHVVNFRVSATNSFLRLGESSKALYCITQAEHPHVIASEILSPSAVGEIAEAVINFLRSNLFVTNPGTAATAENALSTKNCRRERAYSVPTGLGRYASFPSLVDLNRPVEI